MNQSLTLCCAICIFGQTAGIGQTPEAAIAEPPAELGIKTSAWTIFSHPALGYELPVPPGVKPSGNPEKTTEARFVSQDGSFAMTARAAVISGYPPWVLESNWKQALRLRGPFINYQRKAGSWFVVSGFDRNGTGFYQKFIVSGNKVATFTLTYPHSRLREFDSWVSGIQDRFHIVSAPVPVPARETGSQSPDPSPVVDLTPPTKSPGRQPVVVTHAFDTENLVLEEKTMPEESPAKDTPPKEPRLPYGVQVEGKPGFVYTPYGSKQMVDVVDLSPGTKVKCPYTDKLFRVP